MIYRVIRQDGKVKLFKGATGNWHEVFPERSRVLRDHSTEFEMGYGGSGPAQLALALSLEVLDNAQSALDCYQRFKVAWLLKERDEFTITKQRRQNQYQNF